MHSEYTADLEKSNTISQKSLVFKKNIQIFKKKAGFQKKSSGWGFPLPGVKKKPGPDLKKTLSLPGSKH